jgi:hypothetical protein
MLENTGQPGIVLFDPGGNFQPEFKLYPPGPKGEVTYPQLKWYEPIGGTPFSQFIDPRLHQDGAPKQTGFCEKCEMAYYCPAAEVCRCREMI